MNKLQFKKNKMHQMSKKNRKQGFAYFQISIKETQEHAKTNPKIDIEFSRKED